MPNPKPLALAHQCQLCPIPFTAPFADGIEEFKLSSNQNTLLFTHSKLDQ